MAGSLWQSQKRAQQEFRTVPHAQRPPSADAADLNGSAMPPTPIRSFVRSLARSLAGALVAKIFRRRENFGDAKILEKKVWVVAIVFVKKSSKSEPSSRFLNRLKFGKFACHFLANSADRPRIYIETLYKTNFPWDVCLNSSKSGG